MAVLSKIQLTAGQVATLEVGGVTSIPAGWDDFLEFLEEAHYRAEYHNGNIIIMGLATLVHELLVSQMIFLLKRFYAGKPYYVAGSNVGIRKAEGQGHYNGDVVVINGEPNYQGHSRSIITNPYLLVEVLSESTAAYDMNHKLRKYQAMESVREVVFVDPFDRSVTRFRRTETANVWTETIYEKPEELILIDGYSVVLSEIFANLPTES